MPMPSVDDRGNDLQNIYHIANCAVRPQSIVQSTTERQNLRNSQARPRNFTSDAKDLCHHGWLKLATGEADSANASSLDRVDDRVHPIH